MPSNPAHPKVHCMTGLHNDEARSGARLVSLSGRGPTPVVVFGGDPAVGRILELLLRGAGYDARFVTDDSLDEPGLFDGVRLLLFFAAGLSPERREASMSLFENAPGLAGLPILELASHSDGAQARMEHLVPWPCPVEELRRRMEAALVGAARLEEREASHG